PGGVLRGGLRFCFAAALTIAPGCPTHASRHGTGTQVLWSRRRRIALGGFESLELFSPDFALRLQLDALSHQLDHLRLVASLKVHLARVPRSGGDFGTRSTAFCAWMRALSSSRWHEVARSARRW